MYLLLRPLLPLSAVGRVESVHFARAPVVGDLVQHGFSRAGIVVAVEAVVTPEASSVGVDTGGAVASVEGEASSPALDIAFSLLGVLPIARVPVHRKQIPG